MKSKSLIRPILWSLTGALSLLVMAASSPQCARTSDRTLSPVLEPLGAGNPCIDRCNNAFKSAQKAEQARHKSAVDACNGDPVCKQKESDTHNAIMDELTADKDACKLDCQHQQGTATGGQ